MTIEQKIELACKYAGISKSEMARRLGMTPQNFNQRLKREGFSHTEMQKIGQAVGAQWQAQFVFKDGQRF